MILYTTGTGLYETRRALLKQLDPSGLKLPRYFSTSEQLVTYLSKAPDTKFILTSEDTAASSDNLLTESALDAYGPQFGDIMCGVVLYDSTKNQVLTVGTYTPNDVARIFGG
ncbi:hypothetical protein CR51_20900 [Caballeronia megalochromosomata]|nr:hypothetical protein CR51_20900 [Caballeronia megalochromosomata]